MGLFSSEEFKSLRDLFEHEIEDVYDANKRLLKALDKMREAAHSERLDRHFAGRRSEIERNITTMEAVFRALNLEPKREVCPAMKGLIAEAEEMVDAHGNEDACDAALIVSAQRIEHYLITGFGSATAHARQLQQENVAQQLHRLAMEAGAADETLTRLAEQINVTAAVA